MAEPPWKRALPPEPPKREGFVTPSRNEETLISRIPPASPTDRLNSSTSENKSHDQKKKATNPKQRKKQKRNPLLLLLFASLLLLVSVGSFYAWNQQKIDENPANDQPGSSAVVSTLVNNAAEGTETAETVPQGMWDEIARSVVYIEALGARCNWSGSGSLVLDGSYVLTNEHVSGSGECDLSVFLTDSSSKTPTRRLAAVLVAFEKAKDLAVLRLFDSDGTPFFDESRSALKINVTDLQLGTKVFTLGYPAAGGSTITFTSGDFAGMDDTAGVFYKTTAYMNSGVSGGAGLNERGELIGVPTAGKIDYETNEKLGINLIRPITYAIGLLETALSKDVKKSGLDTKNGTAEEGSESKDTTAEYETVMDPIFDTCRQAKSRGYGPYYRGQDLEYDFYQDRDRDGIVCE